MPKGSKQTRADIVCTLKQLWRPDCIIDQEQLEDAMRICGVTAPASKRAYIKALVKENYLIRTGGGFRLSQESRRTKTISIKVSPAQQAGEVERAINAAIQRFGNVTTMEMEI